MMTFIQRSWWQIIILIFSAGSFITLMKIFFNDLKHLERDYYPWKEDVIKRLSRIETLLEMLTKGGN